MAKRPPNYQDVRGLFEKTTYDALRAAGIAADAVFFDNFGETPPGPDVSYALVSLTFDSTVQDVIGCEGLEDLRGTLQCNVYTPKKQGSKPGEDICLEVVQGWLALNRRSTVHPSGIGEAVVRNLDGPRTIAPDARPHHVNVISCAFYARALKEVTTP